MDAGHWTILWKPWDTPLDIPVQHDEVGLFNPSCKHRNGSLVFSWHDGREMIISLHAIKTAEFTPTKNRKR